MGLVAPPHVGSSWTKDWTHVFCIRQILYHWATRETYWSHSCVENLLQLFTDMVLSLSCVWLLVTSWNVAHEAPLPKGFLRQEHWSELPFPFPSDLPNPGIEPASPVSPALVGRFFYHWATKEALLQIIHGLILGASGVPWTPLSGESHLKNIKYCLCGIPSQVV